ncbi:hypothetical protein M427DRAFT_490854 [Gonapodya prolifera JEL478]|uniref:AB hydrolase-1 domain-containing protein n=1 Tax=Gonapodya prolifera (strain JEL478) TaxID=1344416 RepID=A0A139AMD8_GONPJ|nr:hypothetical protein M427DRAFT_490854 [Gonapodya prolifera JEL478]|eukprot:KXS17868.1 hypothetical protein M427DRAFT_490854 [Gonapodya prolifera JEL478]
MNPFPSLPLFRPPFQHTGLLIHQHIVPGSEAGASRGAVNVFFAHANGTGKGTWRTTVRSRLEKPAVRAKVGVLVAWDTRNHGDSAQLNPNLPKVMDDWSIPAVDLLSVLKTLKLHPTVSKAPLLGVGHSFGANLVLAAEIIESGTWNRIAAIEPIVFPHEGVYDEPLSAGAYKRKNVFASRDAAYNSWRSRPGFFQRWHPDSLRGYVDDGIIGVDDSGNIVSEEDIANGKGKVAKWTLKTPREQEGGIFELAGRWPTSGWVYACLDKVTPPTHLVSGTESAHRLQLYAPLGANPEDVMPKTIAIAKSVKNGTHEWVNADHMVPQEKPNEVAQIIEREILKLIVPVKLQIAQLKL